VVFYKRHRLTGRAGQSGFTLVEAVVAVTLIGVGVASTLGALSKFNTIAASSRNATGASAVLMNQADLFASMSPFNPQKMLQNNGPCTGATPPPQIPKDYCNNPPTYDMTVGTHTLSYKDPTTGVVSTQTDPWPVYREPARWNYADAATRDTATGFANSDLGQLAYQSDNQTFWRLQSTTPTWAQDTTGGIIVKGTMTCTVTDVSDLVSVPPIYRYQAVFTIGYQYMGRGPTWSAARNRWEYQQSMTVVRSSDI
jgi:prepilin-type N-terminal cleavage/methylation domain-containing protein